jgi:hypothetical protein
MLDVVAACVNSVYTVFGNCQQGTLTWGAPNSNPRTVVFSGAFCLKVLVPLSATKFDFIFQSLILLGLRHSLRQLSHPCPLRLAVVLNR